MTEKLVLQVGKLYEWSAQLYNSYPSMQYGVLTASLLVFNIKATRSNYIISDGERLLYLGQQPNPYGENLDYLFLIDEKVMSIGSADIVKVLKPVL